MALSDTWLRANLNKPRGKTEVKSDRDGLGVRVSPRGKVVFQLRYRYAGKASRVDLGTYPLVSLRDARAKSHRLRAELEAGNDPKIVLALEKLSAQSAGTFEELVREWYTGYCEKNKNNPQEILRTFELHVFPKIGQLPVDKISLQLWMGLLEPMAEKKPGIASRVLTNSKQVYKWAIKREMAEYNPLADIYAGGDLQVSKRRRERVLDNEELKYLWMALDGSRMTMKNRILLKLCLIYGCRVGELRLAEQDHLDFQSLVWVVPAENHKMGKKSGKPLKRPIIPIVRLLFEEAIRLSGSKRFIFTGESTDEPVGDRAHLALPYNIRQWLRRNQEYEMAHWSVHDLRRTARTNFSSLTAPHVAEIMLGHTLPGQWMVYDQHDYMEEQRKAYEDWWKRIQEIIA